MTRHARPVAPPGSILGILGSGQLGRMLALVAKRMGYRVHVFSPLADSPAGQVADVETVGSYLDGDAVVAFAAGLDVLTIEFENIPASALEAASAVVPIRPGTEALHLTQHRLREKAFLVAGGFPHAPFRAVASAAACGLAVAELGGDVVVKTSGFGYDGKGQARARSADEARAAFATLVGERDAAAAAHEADEADEGTLAPVVVERFVPFSAEVSVVAARDAAGRGVSYPLFENHHRNHVLDLTLAPARVERQVADEARRLADAILEALGLVGVACVEFFVTHDGELLVNEIAPRPHNSGHLTIEAAAASQFEQQLRAVCGLPLAAANLRSPAAMTNLLGDLWAARAPRWERALREGVSLHLYGKAEARPGRKMGHLTALAPAADRAADLVLGARERLSRL